MLSPFNRSIVLAASLCVSACSSGGGDSNAEEDLFGDGAFPEAPSEANPEDASSAYDLIATSDDHRFLAAAIRQADLADLLDADGSSFTIFAPVDTAFEELAADMDGDLADLLADEEALLQILTQHIVQGELTETDIATRLTSSGEGYLHVEPLLAESSLSIRNGIDSAFMIASQAMFTPLASQWLPAGDGARGVVYPIDAVLRPSSWSEPENIVDSGVVTDLLAGDNALFLQAFSSQFGWQKLDAIVDPNPWTVFAPTDSGVGDGVIDARDYILTSGRYDSRELIEAGEMTTFGGSTLTFGGTVEALTVNGVPASLVGSGSAASVTYSVDGL